MDNIKCNTKSLSMFLVLVFIYTLKGGNGKVIKCIENEKHALLKLKQGMIDRYNDLSSWGSEENKSECCSWNGVECGNGHVIGLELYRLMIHNLDWLSNLSSLSSLYLRDSSFTQSLETIMFRNILMIPSLHELDLSTSTFTNVTSSVNVYANSTLSSLYHLDLQETSLTSLAFQWLFNISTSLVWIDLSKNKLDGPIPDAFGKFVFLAYLDLSYNRLEGGIPKSLWNSRILQNLYLSHNELTEPLPEFIGMNMSMDFLDLSYNRITGTLPQSVGELSKLISLDVSHNHISGKLPDLSSKLSAYPAIDFSFNKFSGLIPSFHPNTFILSLSNNKFSGSISFLCESNFHLFHLLDLSKNQLSGQLPNCWDSMSVRILDLSNNSFSGKIPNSMGYGLFALFLGNNNFSGELPSGLNNSRFLSVLDVGGNKLTGKIPAWIGTDHASLVALNIRGNNFFGSIPPGICHLTQIQILDLSRNNLSGTIPLHCFKNFTNLFQKNSIPMENDLYKILMFYYKMAKLEVQLKGHEYEYGTTLYLLKLIDLSSNKIEGDIPTDVFQMKELLSLNLSRNHLRGHIDPAVHQMESLESLDLSRNQLSGEIPMGLGDLPFLDFLDLSNNNFSGKIPSGTQLQGFNASAYAGNIGLCGSPLPSCPEDGPNPPLGEHEKLDKGDANGDAVTNQSFLKEFYIAIVLGFIVGFWGAVGTLLLRKSWRYAYFNFFDSICLKAATYMRRL